MVDTPLFDVTAASLLALALLVFFAGRFETDLKRAWDQLRRELRLVPVHSAETTRRREAEFIDERLLVKLPLEKVAIALAILAAAVWWLSR